jgi:hypothetical protein
MVEMNVKRRRGTSYKKYFLLILWLPISFLGYFFWETRLSVLNAFALARGEVRDIVVYDTYKVWVEGGIPFQEELKESLGEVIYEERNRFEIVEKKEDSDLQIEYSLKPTFPLYSSYLVPVRHVYSMDNEVTSKELKGNVNMWDGTSTLIQNLFGGYDPQTVQELGGALLKDESKVGLIEITSVTKELQVVALEGVYFFDDPLKGGFAFSLDIGGDTEEFIKDVLKKNSPEEVLALSFHPEQVVKINMTGVTAITRALASKTNASGDDAYAAELIGEFLSDADLTHVSNEVSFIDGCLPSSGLRFCSDTRYLAALEKSGVDIVELTGNHNNDYGSLYNTESIEMYTERGWDHFGGGLDSEDAKKILVKEVKGSKVAFIGYNYYDTIYASNALAGENKAGANSYSESKVEEDVVSAKKVADLVIVDFQFQECYSYPEGGGIYPVCYKPIVDQADVFRHAIDSGADIVIGTQAHQPQTYELYGDGIIFYGLGNLYFDQIPWIGTRHGLVLSHYLYKGKYLTTQITTTNYGNDMQTYVSTGDERE